MICSISGNTPEEPVVSQKSGHIFERRLIEKYIEANGKDPISNDPITLDELVVVKVGKTVKPRPVTATSIPSMLQLFQNEWDALMLETFTLKQHLETVRQELAHALYQHDAACRVIARLIKERDAAKNALAQLQAQLPEAAREAAAHAASESMEIEAPTGINDTVRDKMAAKSQTLSKERKKRQISPTLAKEEDLREYNVLSSNPTHKASQPGILCLDIHPNRQELIVTGGMDANAVVFNKDSSKVVATLTGHTKRVNDVLFHPTEDVIFTCSQDKTARIFVANNEGFAPGHVLRGHTDDVVGLTLHATGEYLVTASLDKTWSFYDVRSGQCLIRIADPQVKAGYESVSFHPDGLILGTGTADSLVRIWDIKAQTNVATFEGHQGRVVDLAFSENGYYLATAAADSVKLWDLRKLKNFHTINLDPGAAINAVEFDFSGNYLAVAGSDIKIYAGKNFGLVRSFTDHSAVVTDVKFGQDAHWFASTSMDRSLKIFGRQ